MKRSLITAAATEPCTVDELRLRCRLDSHEEDALLSAFLREGREMAEEYLWRRLVNQTWDQYYDDFSDPMRLDLCPVRSITSITYLDFNGTSQPLATTVYELGEEDEVGNVRLKYNQSWPTTYGTEDSVTVRHVVGYGTSAASVPENIKAAIYVYARHHFNHRDGEPVPQTFYDLLFPFRAWRF